MSGNQDIMLFGVAAQGHRRGHLEYFRSLAGDRPCEIAFGPDRRQFRRLVRAGNVVLSSADHYLPFALAVGLVRRLMGKRSGATFIAAERMGFGNGFGWGLKGLAMRAARVTGVLDAVTISPFGWSPHLAALCRGWIYDPQFCAPNLGGDDLPDEREKELLDWAAARPDLVVLLGNLHPERGLSDMIAAAERAPDTNFLVAGRPTPAGELLARADAGLPPNLRIEARPLTTPTFDRLIELAGLLWCYFPREYDQNSGLFCNGVRAGRNMVVRRGSLIHWLAAEVLKAGELPRPGWLAEDAVVFSSLANRREFLDGCAARNLSWIRSVLGASSPPSERAPSDSSPAPAGPETLSEP